MQGSGFDQQVNVAPHLQVEIPDGGRCEAHFEIDAAINHKLSFVEIGEDVPDSSGQYVPGAGLCEPLTRNDDVLRTKPDRHLASNGQAVIGELDQARIDVHCGRPVVGLMVQDLADKYVLSPDNPGHRGCSRRIENL